MKRIIAFLLCAALLLCSCSKDPYEDIVVDMDTLMSDIISTQDLAEPMMVISSDEEEYKELFDDIIKAEYVRALMAFPEVGIGADMIIIVEMPDNSYADVLSSVNDYMMERKDAYEGYAPEEAKRFDSVTFSRYGRYLFVHLLPDVKTADEFVWSVFNRE